VARVPRNLTMIFTDQMATKLLAQAVRKLTDAINEALCATPDKRLVREVLNQVRSDLHEFEDAYFDEDKGPPQRR